MKLLFTEKELILCISVKKRIMIPFTKPTLIVRLFVLFLLLLSIKQQTFACSITTNLHINLSLGLNGQHTVIPDELTEGTPTCAASLEVTIFNSDYTERANPIIDCQDVGKTILARVRDQISGSFGYTQISVFDVIGPQITAPNLTLKCTDNLTDSVLNQSVVVSDNCTDNSNITIHASRIRSNLSCNQSNALTIVRSVFAMDESGNRSNTITQTVTIERISLSDVLIPNDTTYLASDLGICPSQMNMNIPVGEPTVVGGQGISGLCKIQYSTRDELLTICNGGKKLRRRYLLLDCCTNETSIRYQTIAFMDDVAPTIAGVLDTFNASPVLFEDCKYQLTAPSISTVDDCGNTVDVVVKTPFGDINGSGGTLPFLISSNEAPFLAIYEATDACGNIAKDTMVVTAKDVYAPVCIGISYQTTVLTNGLSSIPAENFDSGSRDNCCLNPFEVRRMGDTLFRNAVDFTCADVNDTVAVEFKVTDCEGNSNVCMLNVFVQDAQVATINGLQPIETSCELKPVPLNISGTPTVNQSCDDYTFSSFSDQDLTPSICGTGETIRTYYFLNSDGDTLSSTQQITYIDESTPKHDPVADVYLSCGEDLQTNVPTPVVTTNCQQLLGLTAFDVINVQSCTTQIIASHQYTSACSDFDYHIVQNVFVINDAQPSFNNPVLSRTFSCDNLPTTILTSDVPVANNSQCGNGTTTIELIEEKDSINTVGTCQTDVKVFSFRAIDDCGNISDTIEVTYSTVDDVAPTVSTRPASINVVCMAEIPSISSTQSNLVLTDNCDPSPSIVSVVDFEDSSNNSCSGHITRIYEFTDRCGNRDTVQQHIYYNDNVMPQVDPLDEEYIGCVADVPAPNTDLVSATDNCGGNLSISVQVDTSGSICSGQIIHRYTVSDPCGNAATVDHIFNVEDNTAPNFTFAVTELDIETINSCEISALGLQVIAEDNCSGGSIEYTNNSPYNQNTNSANGNYPVGTTNILFTASDQCGNIAEHTMILNVNDLTAPTLQNCNDTFFIYPAINRTYTLDLDSLRSFVSPTDNCDAPADINLTHNGNATYTCDVTDSNVDLLVDAADRFGNSTSCNYILAFRDPNDYCHSVFKADLKGKVNSPKNYTDNSKIELKAEVNSISQNVPLDNSMRYSVENLPGNEAIHLSVESNMDKAFGLSTFDMYLISEHLLGNNSITNPYELLAADFNNDGEITSYDIALLRRTVLDFPSANTDDILMRLAIDNHTFSNPTNPWIDEVNGVSLPVYLQKQVNNVDLAIYKAGDVDANRQLKPRNIVEANFENQYVEKGNEYTIEINLPKTIDAFQMGLIAKGQLTLENFNGDILSNIKGNTLLISGLNGSKDPFETLTVKFIPQSNGELNQLLQLASGFESMSIANNSPAQLVLTNNNSVVSSSILMPNPFGDELRIVAENSFAIGTKIQIYDTKGQLMLENTVEETNLKTFSVDSKKWSEGIYFINILKVEGQESHKALLLRRP